MKKWFVSGILILMASFWPVNEAVAQVKVKVKPVPPSAKMKTPEKPDENSVLLPARWVWHRSTQKYIWLSPAWVEPPSGKMWAEGYWEKVYKGWKWMPGKWERKTKLLKKHNSK